MAFNAIMRHSEGCSFSEVSVSFVSSPRHYAALSALVMILTLTMPQPAMAEGKLRRFIDTQQQNKTAQTGGSASRVMSDLAYGHDQLQKLDVYLPARPQGAPILMMVHGGGWRRGDKTNTGVIDNKVSFWVARQGYIFVSVNYRLLPEANPLQQADDIMSAIAFTQKHAREWGGDPDRLVLMGHSAGGHLVALVAANPAKAAQQGAGPWRGTVVLDIAALDLETRMKGRPSRLHENAFGNQADMWREASPLAQLTPQAAPFLIVCSSQRNVSCTQAKAFVDTAQRLGVAASVLPQALSHGDINKKLGIPGSYTAAVDEFIRSQVNISR